MARYGSPAIRGHGIPEAMEQVLTNESRIPPRVTLLKPLSAAVAIGTGGPFGAEGPIIATGGALGSLLGPAAEHHRRRAEDRCSRRAPRPAWRRRSAAPVAAVLLAVELLLFEYRPRSLVPVALASCRGDGVRIACTAAAPVFAMPDIAQPGGAARSSPTSCSAAWSGWSPRWITRRSTRVEDAFEQLPIHWMWWPALGALAVGVVGYLAPRTLGVGYDNIEDILTGRSPARSCSRWSLLKFISWAVALGSGTSGGTLAPLFTIGGGLGLADRRGADGAGPRAGDGHPRGRRWWAWPRCSPAPRARCWRRSSSPSRPPGSRWACCRCWPAARRPISSRCSGCSTRS